MSIFYRKQGLPITELFIETGTHDGGSVDAALEIGYPEIRSCECNEEYFRRCRRKYSANPRVKLFHGPSPDLLRLMIEPDKTTTFWLDAHFMGSHVPELQNHKYGQCPLLYELDVINFFSWKQLPIIVIDDWPNFHGGVGEGYIQAEWPLWSQVEKRLHRHTITIEQNIAWALPEWVSGGLE